MPYFCRPSHIYLNVFISLKSKFTSAYNLSDTAVSTTDSQKDLGIIVSNNLSWVNHYNHIIPCAYKILGLIHHLFSPSLSLSVKLKLYLTLVRSQLMYCTPIWHPYLLKAYRILKEYNALTQNLS